MEDWKLPNERPTVCPSCGHAPANGVIAGVDDENDCWKCGDDWRVVLLLLDQLLKQRLASLAPPPPSLAVVSHSFEEWLGRQDGPEYQHDNTFRGGLSVGWVAAVRWVWEEVLQ